jgi:hypothetical protein
VLLLKMPVKLSFNHQITGSQLTCLRRLHRELTELALTKPRTLRLLSHILGAGYGPQIHHDTGSTTGVQPASDSSPQSYQLTNLATDAGLYLVDRFVCLLRRDHLLEAICTNCLFGKYFVKSFQTSEKPVDDNFGGGTDGSEFSRSAKSGHKDESTRSFEIIGCLLASVPHFVLLAEKLRVCESSGKTKQCRADDNTNPRSSDGQIHSLSGIPTRMGGAVDASIVEGLGQPLDYHGCCMLVSLICKLIYDLHELQNQATQTLPTFDRLDDTLKSSRQLVENSVNALRAGTSFCVDLHTPLFAHRARECLSVFNSVFAFGDDTGGRLSNKSSDAFTQKYLVQVLSFTARCVCNSTISVAALSALSAVCSHVLRAESLLSPHTSVILSGAALNKAFVLTLGTITVWTAMTSMFTEQSILMLGTGRLSMDGTLSVCSPSKHIFATSSVSELDCSDAVPMIYSLLSTHNNHLVRIRAQIQQSALKEFSNVHLKMSKIDECLWMLQGAISRLRSIWVYGGHSIHLIVSALLGWWLVQTDSSMLTKVRDVVAENDGCKLSMEAPHESNEILNDAFHDSMELKLRMLWTLLRATYNAQWIELDESVDVPGTGTDLDTDEDSAASKADTASWPSRLRAAKEKTDAIGHPHISNLSKECLFPVLAHSPTCAQIVEEFIIGMIPVYLLEFNPQQQLRHKRPNVFFLPSTLLRLLREHFQQQHALMVQTRVTHPLVSCKLDRLRTFAKQTQLCLWAVQVCTRRLASWLETSSRDINGSRYARQRDFQQPQFPPLAHARLTQLRTYLSDFGNTDCKRFCDCVLGLFRRICETRISILSALRPSGKRKHSQPVSSRKPEGQISATNARARMNLITLMNNIEASVDECARVTRECVQIYSNLSMLADSSRSPPLNDQKSSAIDNLDNFFCINEFMASIMPVLHLPKEPVVADKVNATGLNGIVSKAAVTDSEAIGESGVSAESTDQKKKRRISTILESSEPLRADFRLLGNVGVKTFRNMSEG